VWANGAPERRHEAEGDHGPGLGRGGYEAGELSARLALKDRVAPGRPVEGRRRLREPHRWPARAGPSPRSAPWGWPPRRRPRPLPALLEGELRLYGPPVDADCVRDMGERPAAYAGTMPAAYGKLRYQRSRRPRSRRLGRRTRRGAWRHYGSWRPQTGPGSRRPGTPSNPAIPPTSRLVSVAAPRSPPPRWGQLDPLGRCG
jgi:hypothetical protein